MRDGYATRDAKPQAAGMLMQPEKSPGVFAVQCPNPKCRKYMLVEERDRNKVVACLLCKTPIRVGGEPAARTGTAQK